jgi:hypothetical protein
VVVGEPDGADADRAQRLDRSRRPPEEEGLAGDALGRVPARRDAALEVADDEVEREAQLAQLRRPEVLRVPALELGGDAASEHHVAEEANAHGV